MWHESRWLIQLTIPTSTKSQWLMFMTYEVAPPLSLFRLCYLWVFHDFQGNLWVSCFNFLQIFNIVHMISVIAFSHNICRFPELAYWWPDNPDSVLLDESDGVWPGVEILQARQWADAIFCTWSNPKWVSCDFWCFCYYIIIWFGKLHCNRRPRISWNSFWELLCLIKSPFFIYVYTCIYFMYLFAYLFCILWVCGHTHSTVWRSEDNLWKSWGLNSGCYP